MNRRFLAILALGLGTLLLGLVLITAAADSAPSVTVYDQPCQFWPILTKCRGCEHWGAIVGLDEVEEPKPIPQCQQASIEVEATPDDSTPEPTAVPTKTLIPTETLEPTAVPTETPRPTPECDDDDDDDDDDCEDD